MAGNESIKELRQRMAVLEDEVTDEA